MANFAPARTAAAHTAAWSSRPCPAGYRCLVRGIQTTSAKPANPLPITGAGPPPGAPLPPASEYGSRIDRRRRQAELLRRSQDARAVAPPGKGGKGLLRQRFWKDVSVQTDPSKAPRPNVALVFGRS